MKRGIEFSLRTIIIIVLAIVTLLFVLFSFTSEFGATSGNIADIGGALVGQSDEAATAIGGLTS